MLLGLVVILALYDAPISWGLLGLFTVTQGTVLQFWTPGFLRGYGCGTPNGALWTIGVMVQFYVAVYFLHKLLRNKGLKTWLEVLAGAVFVDLLSPLLKSFLPEIMYKLYSQTVIPYAWMFLAGVLLAAKRDVLMPLVRKYWVLLWAASAVLGWTKFDISMGDYRLFSCLTLVAGVIGFAYQFPKLNIKIDISYGVYVYHMIVVNAMMALGFTGKPAYVLIVLLVTCLIAFISERTVGRWSIQLKKKQ